MAQPNTDNTVQRKEISDMSDRELLEEIVFTCRAAQDAMTQLQNSGGPMKMLANMMNGS